MSCACLGKGLGVALLLLGCWGCEDERPHDVQVVLGSDELGAGRPRGLHVDDTHIYRSQACYRPRYLMASRAGYTMAIAWPVEIAT